MICTAKILVFSLLIIVQIFTALVYKFSLINGVYQFSTLSVVILAEAIKFCMSFSVSYYFSAFSYMLSVQTNRRNYTAAQLDSLQFSGQNSFSYKLFVQICFLSALYFTNNQIAFILYEHIDIVTISLWKTLVSIETAIFSRILFRRSITDIQWCSIILQILGLIIAQNNICQQKQILETKFYFILFISCSITCISSVWNEHLLKGYSVDLHTQNSILYFFGIIFNMTAYIIDVLHRSPSSRSFFDGYNAYTVAIIFCNAVTGIVITAVYRYADAVTKTFSSACTIGIMIIMNWTLFNEQTDLMNFLGATVIFLSSYIYLSPSKT